MEIIPLTFSNFPVLHLIVDDNRDKVIAPYIKRHKIWEPAETNILLRIIKPGYRVVDVGANVGYYTLLFSQAVGETGQVYAFEPEPANYRLLCANLLINNCVNVVSERRALADQAGHQTLYLSGSNLGDHRLFPAPGRAACEVETCVLDDYLPDQSIDFVKLDTQGSEPRILAGMTRLIDRCRDRLGCLMEFCPGLLERSGFGLGPFLTQLQSLQAAVYWLQSVEQTITLTRLQRPADDLRGLAEKMLATGVEDYSQDVLVFFSAAAEERHLARNLGAPST